MSAPKRKERDTEKIFTYFFFLHSLPSKTMKRIFDDDDDDSHFNTCCQKKIYNMKKKWWEFHCEIKEGLKHSTLEKMQLKKCQRMLWNGKRDWRVNISSSHLISLLVDARFNSLGFFTHVNMYFHLLVVYLLW